MKWVTLTLTAALLWFQYNLWTSWKQTQILHEKVAAQKEQNQRLALRNEALHAEIESLEQNQEAMVEIARTQLGYIQSGEIYYRLIESPLSKTIP